MAMKESLHYLKSLYST